MAKRTLYGTVIVTYRCNARCNMCDCFKDPTRPDEEITLEDIRKLPEMAFTNITGGEPFIRQDIPDIVRELYKKSDRIVISTNGYFTDRIIALCREFPKVGIRISIEGLQATNDAIRGIPDGFNRGYRTLKTLVEMKHPDVGFGMTVQDMNCEDLVPLYNIANDMGMEFATATLHNSFYFRKTDNRIDDKYKVAQNFEKLINELLRSKSPKKWFRAYFNHGLINYIYGNKKEIAEYKAIREKGVPVKPITIREPGAPEEVHTIQDDETDKAAEEEFLIHPTHDTGSIWYMVISFFLPILGLIAALLFKKFRHTRNYKMCRKGAIAGFILIGVILLVFLLLLWRVVA